MIKYATLMMSLLLVCLISGRSYAWFSLSEDREHHEFTPTASMPVSTNTYVLPYNIPNDRQNSEIFPKPGSNTTLFADSINIDIPLIILENEVIDVEESLDRLLAANLRIQNILDEYLAFKKRAELLLKNLRIPYLEKSGAEFKPKSVITGRKGNTLKKEIRNIIRHGSGYNWTNSEQVETAVAAIHQTRQSVTGPNRHLDQGLSDIINQSTGSVGYQKVSTESFGKQIDYELPWIFRFVFSILSYANNNKLEILLWSVTLLISMLIVTMVIRQ